MATTSPDNIQYPVNSDQVAPLASHFKNVADSTQAALNNKASTIALTAEETARIAGDAALQTQITSNKQTQRMYVKNGAVALTKGTPVYITGADGTNVIVGAASNASEAGSSKTIGLLETDLAINAMGYVVTAGLCTNIDTSGAGAAGDPVWLGVDGAKIYGLANKPVTPAHMVYLGVVSRKNANTGEIEVRVQNGFELEELHNVLITNPQDKQVVAYEGGLWKNKQATGGVTVGATAPAGPNPGDAWYNSNNGMLYVWYVDADSTAQWVQVKANSGLEASILSRLGSLESQAIAYGQMSPNYIINGGFDIWQRGTSFNTTGVFFGPDRWKTYSYSGSSSTLSQQVFTPGAAPVSGYEGQYFLRHSSTNTGHYLEYPIEDVRTLAGQTATFSFWAKGATAFTTTVGFAQSFGTGGSTAVSISGANVSVTTSWQRFTITLAIPSISGKTIGTNNSLNFYITSSTTGQNLDLWGVQLELGSTATPFRRNANSIQGELAACQRYYTRFSNINSAAAVGMATAFGTGNLQCFMNLPVTMRTIPSAESGPLAGISWEGGTSSGNTPTYFSIRALDTTPNVLAYELTKTSGWASDGRAYHVHLNTTSGAYIAASAEL